MDMNLHHHRHQRRSRLSLLASDPATEDTPSRHLLPLLRRGSQGGHQPITYPSCSNKRNKCHRRFRWIVVINYPIIITEIKIRRRVALKTCKLSSYLTLALTLEC